MAAFQQTQTKDALTLLLERCEREQREFQNHWLWQELKTTPQDFFARVKRQVAQSGIDPEVWRQKLSEAKQAIETRVKERAAKYERVNFKHCQGLKA